MKTQILFFIFFFLFNYPAPAQKKGDVIPWDENRVLVWGDFKGKPEAPSPFGARTSGTIRTEFETLPENGLKLILHVEFDRKKSWKKSKDATDGLLKHEIFHFHLYEVCARQMVQRIREKGIKNGKNLSDQIKSVFDQTFEEMTKLQDDYDRETNHSENEEKQKEWELGIQLLLWETREFIKKEIIFSQ